MYEIACAVINFVASAGLSKKAVRLSPSRAPDKRTEKSISPIFIQLGEGDAPPPPREMLARDDGSDNGSITNPSYPPMLCFIIQYF